MIIGSNVRFDEGSLGVRQPLEIAQELEVEPDEGHIERPAEIKDSGQGKFQATENPTLSRLSEEYPTPIMSLSPAREPQNEQIRETEQSVSIPSTIDLAQVNAVEEKEPVGPRRSTRVRTQTKMFPGMRAFAARFEKDGEPTTLTAALKEEPVEWNQAIADELRSHMENGTWTQAMLPVGKQALSTKWVFKFKTNADGSRCYKAQLVVRDFEQREGIDFEETFAPVAKFTTVRIMLALATYFDWEVEPMDVKTAFLYPEIEEDVYLKMPEGYTLFYPKDQNAEGIARLIKTLHGLRQSPRAWFKVLDRLFRSKGFSRSNQDSSLYISGDLIILIFVDDIVLFSKNKEAIREVKGWLSEAF